MSTDREVDDKLIDDLGGTGKVAELCEVTPSAVSQWRKDGIPKPWRKYLALARPDVVSQGDSDEAAA